MRRRVRIGHQDHVAAPDRSACSVSASAPVTIWPKIGFRQAQRVVAQPLRNLLVGRILPRAMPAMSATRHSTSPTRRSLSHSANLDRPCHAAHHVIVMPFCGCLAARCARTASPNAANIARDIGVLGPAPFRVPLHAQQEALRARHGDGLDRAVGRDGFGAQGGRQPVDALGVQRIDPERAVGKKFRPARRRVRRSRRVQGHISRRAAASLASR